jgi:hypothetical protein
MGFAFTYLLDGSLNFVETPFHCLMDCQDIQSAW